MLVGTYLRMNSGKALLPGNGALSLLPAGCLSVFTPVMPTPASAQSPMCVAVKLLNAAVGLVDVYSLLRAQRNVRIFHTQADLIGCILPSAAGVINRFLLILPRRRPRRRRGS